MKYLLPLLILFLVSGCSSRGQNYNDLITEAEVSNSKFLTGKTGTCGVLFTKAYLDSISFHSGHSYLNQWGFFKRPKKEGLPSYTSCWRDPAELSQAMNRCQSYYEGKECKLVLFRAYGTDKNRHSTNLASLLDAAAKEKQEKSRILLAQERDKKEKFEAKSRSETCSSFGFAEKTELHSKCMFELYKLEEVAKQNQMTRAAIANASAEQSSLLRQQIEEQKFESGMRLLQQSANILNAPTPTITCKYNAITQTTVCN